MACENAINATDLLRDEVKALAAEAWDALASRAVFANTAVDRIVPAQPPGSGVDVTVEPFFEWAIERPPFGDDPPRIPSAHFVEDLDPYIERKLFTVNTGHATTAYFGAAAGIEKISDALADPAIAAERRSRARGDLRAARREARTGSGGPRRLSVDDPAALPEPLAARHGVARRTPAAAQALTSRALRRPRGRSRRTRPAGQSTGRQRWALLLRSTTPRTSSPWTCSG